MDLKLAVLCAILFMGLGASGAYIKNLVTEDSPPKRPVLNVATGNNTKKCDYLQLAKTYTRCSMPFYADFISDSLQSNPSSCSPLNTFQTCLRDVLEKTYCSNDTTLLTPTIQFFTNNILSTYEQACNTASERKNLLPVANSADASEKKNLSNDVNSTVSHDDASFSKSLVEESGRKSTTATSEANDSNHQTQTLPSAEPNKKAFIEEKPASDNNSNAFSNDMAGVTNADKAWRPVNQSSDADDRKRMSIDDPCEPKLNTGYKFPPTCANRSLLRRMFTCGVSMHEFILHDQHPCKCFMNYRECIMKARKELNCDGGNDKDDPILVTVKLIESLMLSWYQNPCATYEQNHKARASLVGSTERICDATKGSIASVVCYATYLAMTELKTPAPWTNHNDACSAVIDVNRCLAAAEHKSNCTNLEFTSHSRKFLRVITSGKDLQCPGENALPNVQALAAYVKPGCQRSKALKRALRCSVSFQDLADTEHEFTPSQPVPCGHVSRLHTCLEDSVEGTGCYGDINVHSEIKLYKKVLEDAYDVRCLVEEQPEADFRAKNKQHMLRPHAKNIYNQVSGSSGLRSWRIDLGLYDKNTENVGYYYDDSAEGRKAVFAGPRIIAMHPDDSEYSDYDRSDTLYQKARDSNAPNGWRPLAMRLEEHASTTSKVADAAAVDISSNDTTPQTLLQFFKPENNVETVPRARSAELQKVEQIAKKARGKKATGEDDYFFGNDYVENSELAMFPNGLDMFRHFRGGALAKMENVVSVNKSELGANECPAEKVKLALGLCNATLRGLLLRWPNVSDVGLPLDGSSAGVKQFCSDLNSYRGCLAAVLKAYNCSHMQAINGVFEAYRKKMRLPYCASSGSWTRAAVSTLFVGLLANVVKQYI
ncbi:uncharacterized protein [Dermacentor andersoni]|uniref:uncharacterized protein n=1 Tax=Dermacentor andersoni TaxID=34620 RepID=UPI002155774C|nr:uncharacterized protein LOC126545340 [Dermacentor andersoni]